MKYRMLALFFLIFSVQGKTQDDEQVEIPERSNFYYGLNFGGVFANSYTANYYNGSGDFNLLDLISIPQVRDQIFNRIQTPFTFGELPTAMRYKTGVLIGAHIGWYTDESTSFFFNFDFIRLQLSDIFTLWAENPSNPSGDKIIYPEIIKGEENRFNLDFGVHIEFGESKQTKGFIELSGTLNSVKAISNDVIIEGIGYSLFRPPTVYQKTDIGGFGWGFGAGTGVRYHFNDRISFDVGGTAALQRINLYTNEALKLNPVLYLRVIRR